MKTVTAPITTSQKRRAYRAAVQAVLTEFYQTPEPVSRQLVASWWKRLSDSSSFRTGLFMHSEPMNTAADLVQAEVIPLTSELQHVYHEILHKSREKVLGGREERKDIEVVSQTQSTFVSALEQKKIAVHVAKTKKKQEQKYLVARG